MDTDLKKTFSQVSKTYELTNHILTFGLDILWRSKAARLASSYGGTDWIDICSGTGEMAYDLYKYSKGSPKIVALDFTESMIKRAKHKKHPAPIELMISNAGTMPFKDESFDLVTISFATRNLNSSNDHLRKCLVEFGRILKKGGRFINLETSQPGSPIIRKFYHLYVQAFVNPVGRLISGSKEAYKYLSGSIREFYPPDELSDIIKGSGFSNVAYIPIFKGIAAIHTAVK